MTLHEGNGHGYRKVVSGELSFWHVLIPILPISWELSETPWLSTVACEHQLVVHVALFLALSYTQILVLSFPLGPAGSKDGMTCTPTLRLLMVPYLYYLVRMCVYWGVAGSNDCRIRKFHVGSSKEAKWVASIWWYACMCPDMSHIHACKWVRNNKKIRNSRYCWFCPLPAVWS